MKLSKSVIEALTFMVILAIGQGCSDSKKLAKNDARFKTVERRELVQRVTMAGGSSRREQSLSRLRSVVT